MKKILLSLLIALTVFSCKKGTNQTPASTTIKPTNGTTGTVNINSSTYPTVVIGTQTWTSANYNGTGGTNYNDSTTNDPDYGKLYTIAEAKSITLPAGWRLPTVADFGSMISNYDSNVTALNPNPSTHTSEFMAKGGWLLNTGIVQGTNVSGFNAYPAGSMISGGAYQKLGYRAVFWTDVTYISWQSSYAIGYDGNGSFLFEKTSNSQGVEINGVVLPQPERQSLRFVKDN
jgi:uncharacterized protein (TIGR02145 family)